MGAVDLIIANRAYIDHETAPGATRPAGPGAGGLLAVVRPVVVPWDGAGGTTWIGIGRGAHDHEAVDASGYEIIETPRGGLRHRRVFVTDDEWDGHYLQTANGFLWPLLHLADSHLPALASHYPAPQPPSPGAWDGFVAANRALASAALDEPGARSAWVHDYQLALVPRMLRRGGFAGRIGFFLHTPAPDVQIALDYLDERARELTACVLGGILGADLVGLQCEGDVRRFVAAAEELCGARVVAGGVVVEGRHVTVGAYPVGIDVEEVLAVGATAELPPEVRGFAGEDIPFVVGLERADFTKGIPERLDAIGAAYEAGIRFNYAGYASPTRAGVGGYARLQHVIDAKAEAVDALAGRAGCQFFQGTRQIPWDEVIGLQRDADVVFTSSLADGMNLVPLQAAAVQVLAPPGRRATIICGKGAGVAEAYGEFQGEGLVVVDALDPESMRHALTDAVEGRTARVSDRFIEALRQRDAKHWATRYLNDLVGDYP